MSEKKANELSAEDQEALKVFSKEIEQRDNKWFESWGVSSNEKIAAGLAFKSFLEKEDREGFNFYKAPISRKAFMMGWILAFRQALNEGAG